MHTGFSAGVFSVLLGRFPKGELLSDVSHLRPVGPTCPSIAESGSKQMTSSCNGRKFGASELAQQVKVLVTKPEALSSNPRIHTVEELTTTGWPLTSHMCHVT